jgi:hypothetical protein
MILNKTYLSIFLISLSLFHLNFNGKIFFFDVLSILSTILIILLHNKYFFKNILYDYRYLFITILILMLNQILQDSISKVTLITFIKGSIKFLSLFGSCLFIIYFYKNEKKLESNLLIPLCLSMILVYIFQPNIHVIDGDFWKFGLGYPVVILLMIFNYRFKFYIFAFLFILSILVNAKSLALIILIIIFYYYITKLLKFKNITIYLFTIILATISFNVLNNQTLQLKNIIINSNIFIDKNLNVDSIILEESKSIDIKPIKNINIKEGRSDFFNGLNYIYEKLPNSLLLGTGTINKSETITIKTHSHIIGDTVEYGGLLFIFWIFILFYILIMIRLLIIKTVLDKQLIYILISLLLFWDILFSPFSGDHRFITVIYFFYLHFSYLKIKCMQ